MATEQQHLDAVMAALEAAGAVPYTVQQAQRVKVLPPNYTEVGVERLPGGNLRLTATTERRGYIINLVACGRTHEEALGIRAKANGVLEGACLMVDALPTTPIQFASSNQVDLENGVVSGRRTVETSLRAGYYVGAESYTYVH